LNKVEGKQKNENWIMRSLQTNTRKEKTSLIDNQKKGEGKTRKETGASCFDG